MGISVNKTLYFDKVPRAKTLQMLVTFAQATYMFDGDKKKVIENLGVFLDIFKEGGKGSYNGDNKQFNRQYTCARHLGIWENENKGSDLILTNLAKDMVEGRITPEYYLSTVLLNLNEIIQNKSKVINPLHSTLIYMKCKNVNRIKKEDINKIDDFALDERENEFRNIWYSLLYSSVFFNGPNENYEIELNNNIGNIDDIIDACNTSLLTSDASEIENINKKYSNQKIYTDFLTKENEWLRNKYFNRYSVTENNDKIYVGINKIISGAPGTGKSNYIDREFYRKYPTTSRRVTFHPEYTYNDFIGYIRPVVKSIESKSNLITDKLDISYDKMVADKEEIYCDYTNNITYEFVPGPFTELLGEALLDSNNCYYLIIEELNRANAASVFGDLFQLLDRDSRTGESEYGVHNRDLYEYIKKLSKKHKKDISLKDGEIKIPSNFNIIATMNTADQNVFTMDTAFKRRWEFEYIDIDFRDCNFKDHKIKGLDLEWERFVRIINKFMMSEECSDLMIPEDKQIGPFFIKDIELSDSKKFAYKVLMYLWDDVFKMERERIFNTDIRTFSQVVRVFNSQNAINVFNEDIRKILKDNEYMQSNAYEADLKNETPEEGNFYEYR